MLCTADLSAIGSVKPETARRARTSLHVSTTEAWNVNPNIYRGLSTP